MYQPVGEDTRLYLDVPEEWSDIKVTALDEVGSYLEDVDYWHWREAGRMSFLYRQELDGFKVGRYQASPAP